jgi:hypothetical protein
VTETETHGVNGGLQTETFCSFDPEVGRDGDLFTGDCIAN